MSTGTLGVVFLVGRRSKRRQRGANRGPEECCDMKAKKNRISRKTWVETTFSALGLCCLI